MERMRVRGDAMHTFQLFCADPIPPKKGADAHNCVSAPFIASLCYRIIYGVPERGLPVSIDKDSV